MAGHVIAVVGGKGGVGKSIVASNMAISYQQDFKQRPLIVDLDMNSLGDMNLITGLRPNKNIVDVSKLPPGPIDAKVLGQFMVTAPQGYSLIGAPRDAVIAQDLDLDGLGRFLQACKKIFALTVVDCGSAFEPWAMKAMESATAIFVVTAPDIIVVNQTKRALSKIQELLFPPEMVQVILNRATQNTVVTPAVIQRNLNKQIMAMIPEDSNSSNGSLAKSIPVCIAAPSSQMSRAFHDMIRKIYQSRMLDKLEKIAKSTEASSKLQAELQKSKPGEKSDGGGDLLGSSKPVDAWTAMKLRIHKAMVDQIDIKKDEAQASDAKARNVLREKTRKVILDIISQENNTGLLSTRDLKSQMVKEVLDEALGLGPLEDLLKDPNVTEVMVNARDQIYVERGGKLTLSKVHFSSELQMMNVVERIVTPLGRRVDEKVPFVDARLQDGSRVHIIIPPLALRGPTITIRKFPNERLTSKDLVKFGSMTPEIADFLRACVEARLNIVVAGGTGSGKTTLLNVLSNFIPANERIVTVEDAAELQLGQEHVVRLESRPANIEGEGAVSIRELVKCCLRMRPDRIVVGEVRDSVAIDMLQAMNTGHDGSLTTIHANKPRECIQRLETLVMMAGLGLPSKAIREIVASAVDVIIQQSRLSDGSRKVTYITEVQGMQGDTVTLQDIFVFKQEKLDKKRKIIGRYVPTGIVPKFIENMEAKGMKVSRGLFTGRKAG